MLAGRSQETAKKAVSPVHTKLHSTSHYNRALRTSGLALCLPTEHSSDSTKAELLSNATVIVFAEYRIDICNKAAALAAHLQPTTLAYLPPVVWNSDPLGFYGPNQGKSSLADVLFPLVWPHRDVWYLRETERLRYPIVARMHGTLYEVYSRRSSSGPMHPRM